MRKFLLFIALIISGMGFVNAQSIGDNTTINYEGYSLKFTVTSVLNSECEVVCSSKPSEGLSIDEIPSIVTIGGEEYTVTSLGKEAFRSCTNLTSIALPNSIVKIGNDAFSYCTSLESAVIPNSVTTIENSAFYQCNLLDNVTIPNSVTMIGTSAFANCSNLKHIELSNNITNIESLFTYCTSLDTIVVPNSVTTIGTNAFRGCTALKNIIMPNSVTTIGSGAFIGCTALKNVTIPNSVTTIDEYAFKDCAALSNISFSDNSNLKIIGYKAFGQCKALRSISIPRSTERIEGCAFETCENLQTITFDENAKLYHIGGTCFYSCKSLNNVVIPKNVGTIWERVFEGCSSLTDITFLGEITHIGWRAFNDCDKLVSFTVPKTVQTIELGAFCSCDELVEVVFEEGSKIETLSSNYQYPIFGWCKKLKRINIPNTVKVIEYAFEGCTSLDSIVIPNSVTTIGRNAFKGTGLKNVVIPNSVTTIGPLAFYGCTSLDSIVIPNSITTIEENVFYGCSSLDNIEIPNSVTTIKSHAFSQSGLESIVIPNSVTSIDSYTFKGCSKLDNVIIPNSITWIGDYTFEGCSKLDNVIIPNSITRIGHSLFKDCVNLKNVTIPNSVTSIIDHAFRGTAIQNITIPNSVTHIGFCAFGYCSKLETFEMPNSVTSLGSEAFRSCNNLTSITLSENIDQIGSYTFKDCKKLKKIVIPDNVKTIGEWAFSACSVLENISIPKGVTKIAKGAFEKCWAFTKVEIPIGVTEIANGAFQYCSALKTVTIPGTITKIDNYAFGSCSKLEKCRIYAETPPTTSSNVFSSVPNTVLTIEVPEVSLDAYKSLSPYNNYNITSFPGTGSSIDINYGDYVLEFIVTSVEPAECKVRCSTNPTTPTIISIPETVTSSGITYSVTSIADSAFLNCSNLTGIICSNISSIGESAFNGCTFLNNVLLPEGIQMLGKSSFANCTNMTSISLPNSIVSIDEECFSNCTALVTMRSNAISVPEAASNAFNYVPTSLNIQVPAQSVEAYKNADPWRRFVVTKYYPYQIGDHTVVDYDGYSLKYTVKNLEPAEFEVSCSTKPTTMKTISIPRNITYMDTEFEVTSIAASGFASCGLLKGVEISDKIETIGDKAFASCMNLEIIKCHAEEVPTTAMNAFENLSSELSIQVPATSLGAYQVAEPWSNFNVTTLPEVGMSTIVDYDGYSLKFMITNLQPAECEVICSTKPLRRMSISIPATATIGGEIYNVTSLGEYAFANATNISTIKCHLENVPTTASTSFNNASQSMKIQVPSNSVSLYQANAIWNKFDISAGFYSTITATSNNNYYGTVTGGGNYTDGTTATLKAIASEDCSFISWTENGKVVSNNAQYNFVVNDDRELVANFLSGNYWVADMSNYPSRMTVVGQIQIDGADQNVTTLEVGAFCGYELRGSARAKYNSASGKYLVQFEIGGDANETISFKLYNHQTGTEMTLIAPENINFVANGITGDTNNPHILNFVSKVNITAEVNPSDIGTIDGTGIYTIGDEVTLTASTTSSEYFFVSWTENGVVVSVNETYSFIADKNRNLIANYSINNYWNVDDSPFNSNMTIIAVVQIDDVELNSSNYEVGAFCNGELRGSERLKLEQDLDRYFMYLTVYGETNDLISFKLYDHSTQTVSDLTHLEKINFEVNGTIGNLMEPYTFNFLSGVTVSVICNPNQAGTVSGTGKYPLESTATLTATANDGFVFKNWTLNGEVVSTNVTYSFIVEQATELVANFNYVHETELREGWTWYSTYVNVSGSEGLNMMKEDLAESAIQIKGQNNFVNNQNGIWYGQLNGLSSDQMYMIHMSEAATLEMTGELIDPSECPITLSTNWKWISYPLNHSMNLVTALSNYTPSNGDYIKSQNNGFAQYYSSLGWRGTLNSLIPGQGYMYQNTSGSVRILVFADNSTKEMTKENVTTENNRWTPNESKYPTNMTMIAVVESDSNFEVAAFSDGECRGSARPVHIEELDKNIVFMTIYGEGDETINFRYYDINDDEEYVITNTMIFGANATVGDLMVPYVLKLATVNIDEHSENVINIYPNPADRNAEIHFATECEKVEVYNSLGVKISEYENVSHIDGIETSGVYMIKVIMNGNVKYDRIVVR